MGLQIVLRGAGEVGPHTLRAILRRTDLELVGPRDHSPDSIGVDCR